MYTLNINVTQEHINQGTCLNPRACGIALAIRDIFPNALVFGDCLIFDASKEPLSMDWWPSDILKAEVVRGNGVMLSDQIRQFIDKFDHNKSVEPTQLKIDVPQQVIDTINIEEIKQLLADHPTLTLHEKVLC